MSEIRIKTNAANMPMCARQCTTCGATLSGWLPKKDWPRNPPPWDEGAYDRWMEPRRAALEAKRREIEEAQGARNAEWWARYDAHIRSPKWRFIADKVRSRERATCQGCGAYDTRGHCHHADYARMGDEMLFDLLWLCGECHQKMHPHRDLSKRTP